MYRAFFLFFLSLSLKTFSQERRLDAFFTRSAQFPVESVYLHCDKYTAVAGDIIWWKAYVLENNTLSTTSTNLYLELFNQTGDLVMRKLCPIIGGESIGQVELTDSLPAGNYWLRAYTRYQLNFDSSHLFVAPITIYNRKDLTRIRTKKLTIPENNPTVSKIYNSLLITTQRDSVLVCHIDADSGSGLLDRPLQIILLSNRKPLLTADFTISQKRPWEYITFQTKDVTGLIDLLLCDGDDLLAQQAICLKPTRSADVIISTDSLNTNPGGYNAWSVHVNGTELYNYSISVTDADRTSPLPVSITQQYFQDAFNYQAALRETFPVLKWRDSTYLSWKGSVWNAHGKPVRKGELVVLVAQTNETQKPQVIPIDSEGRFEIRNGFFFDSAEISYQLNSFNGDPAAKKILLNFDRFNPPPFSSPRDSLWKDSILDFSNPATTIMDTAIPPGFKIKELPKVTVKGDPRRELNNRYATGIFSELTPYSFDVRTDKTVSGIWQYLRKNLPGFQGGLDIGQMPTFDEKRIVFYVDDQLKSIDEMDDYWYEEIAYIKAFTSLWIDDTRFMRWKTGFTGFVLAGSGPLKVPVQSYPPVICLYTRKGEDIRTAWAGLNKVKISGFSPISQWKGTSDNCATLYWQPMQAGNDLMVRFYNNHTARRFRICIEGITQQGKMLHFEKIIE